MLITLKRAPHPIFFFRWSERATTHWFIHIFPRFLIGANSIIYSPFHANKPSRTLLHLIFLSARPHFHDFHVSAEGPIIAKGDCDLKCTSRIPLSFLNLILILDPCTSYSVAFVVIGTGVSFSPMVTVISSSPVSPRRLYLNSKKITIAYCLRVHDQVIV